MNTFHDSRWPSGAQLAISIAYAGGRPEQLDLAAPLLRDLGLHATFFIEPSAAMENLAGWRAVKEEGHELGNGALSMFSDEGELSNWTHAAVSHEIGLTQQFLEEYLDTDAKGFLYPGINARDGQGSYVPLVEECFYYSVGVMPGTTRIGDSVHQLPSFEVNSYPTEALVDPKLSEGLAWRIIRFDDLLAENNNQRILAHRLALEAVNRMKRNCWIAPIGTVAAEMKRLDSIGRTVESSIVPPLM